MIKFKYYKGFTLLEILLVIAILGILALMILVAIRPNMQLSQVTNARRNADINTIYSALEQYFSDNLKYPAGLTTEKQDICNGSTVINNCVDLSSLVPIYLVAIPVDPSGEAYQVYINPDNNKIGIEAGNNELGQIIAINPISTSPTTTPITTPTPAPGPTPTPAPGPTPTPAPGPTPTPTPGPTTTPEELIQAEIAAGTLVPTGTQQLKYERLVYKNNAGTQTYIDKATTTRTCPSGYIAVPGNSMYGTSEFCVMKYEAKTGSSTVAATTQAAGLPPGWVDQNTARTACGLNGAGYGLITNAEYMTIARNIEAQLSNWTTGTAASTAVGIGGLYRGHSSIWRYGPQLEAGLDSDGYIGTGRSGFDIERRTHTLSNGQIVWDLSGNLWELLNDTILRVNQPNNNSGSFWQEWTVFNTGGSYGGLSYDLTRPSNSSWSSGQNMGRYLMYESASASNVSQPLLRGGHYPESSNGGIFTLGDMPGYGYDRVGFRCVLR